MKVSYNSSASGSVEIPDSELKGKSKDEIEIYINTYIGEIVAEEASDNAEWEIEEED